MESTVFRVVLLSLISINAYAFGVENLTFFGQYVVFKPKTQFVKFDLLEEMDIVLLEHRWTKPNTKLQDTDYLYRIRLIVDHSLTDEVRVNCTIQRKGGNIVVRGQYKFWSKMEQQNMAVSWKSEKRIIEVFTELEGNHNSIFSWKDRSTSRASVKYVGLAVEPAASSETKHDNSTTHRHLNWKIREAEPAEVNVRNTYNMCSVKLMSGNPSNKSSNATALYQISITREDDENFLVSLQKRNDEILRATASRMDCDKVAVSWDSKDKVVSFGLRNDTAPIFLWQDTEENGYDYSNIKFVIVQSWSKRNPTLIEVAKIKVLTIPELFPRYFLGALNAAGRKNEMTSTTVQATTMQPTKATTELITPSSGQPQQEIFGSADHSYVDQS